MEAVLQDKIWKVTHLSRDDRNRWKSKIEDMVSPKVFIGILIIENE